MTATARLNLPYIAPLQSQKQYSYNSAMARLDQLVQPAVLSRTISSPPASPGEGDTYIAGDAATGEWSGKAGQFACWLDGAWSFTAPGEGWLAYVVDSAELAVYQSGTWAPFVTNGGASLAKFGINVAADLTNRLAVAADAALFTHDGSGHRLAVNKAAAGETASVLFEDDFSSRAEIGLIGDDALHVKVSPDGSSWLDVLSVAQASGVVTLPLGQLAFPATPNPSTDSHTLDDYQEGTWTPALNFGGAATGIAYATAAGRYTKIGRKVSVSGNFTLTSKGMSFGAATIAGLPFASANDGIPSAVTVGHAAGMSFVTGAVIATIAPNASQLTLYHSANGSAGALTNTNFSNATTMTFSATYDV